MNIDVTADAQNSAADERLAAPADAMARQHRALCQLGMPLQPGEGGWHRDIGTASLGIEPPTGNPRRPGGTLLRLLLLHIFDTALRQDSTAVEIGESPAVLAARMGLANDAVTLQALADQVERMLAVKITLSCDGNAPLGVFDARGRPRAVAPEWRSAVRLNARFFAGLAEGAVSLDRTVVATLAITPLALDAYMWLAGLLAQPPAEGPPGANWSDLFGRFGDVGQTEETFRGAFEEALRLVTAASPAIVVIVGEQGVQLRPPSAEPPPLRPAPPPRPVSIAPVSMTPEPAAPARAASAPVASAPVAPAPVESAPAPARTAPPPPTAAPPPAARPAPPAEAQPDAGEQRSGGARQSISLKSHMTGLAQVVWLQRANGRETQVIEVTPGGRYDPDHVTVLALEPMVVQISGGLYDREFERVSAWAMNNRDLIDDFWDGKIGGFDEVANRVKKVPAPGWR